MAKQKRRNPYAFDPIMRKGGVHEKSNKAKRNAAKRATQKLVRERRGDAPFFAMLYLKEGILTVRTHRNFVTNNFIRSELSHIIS